MGFMDKAKQMADQAQQKIEEAQKQFNESQSQKSDQGGQPAPVRYDSHGRPIEEPPAAQTPPAPVEQEASGQEPVAEAPKVETPQPAPEVKDGVNAAPDPFKPIQ